MNSERRRLTMKLNVQVWVMTSSLKSREPSSGSRNCLSYFQFTTRPE